MSQQPMQAGIGSMDRPPIELPHPVRMRVLGAVMIGVFLAALDQTVVGTALPRIITDLGGNDLYTWAFTAYLLTSTISGPLYGKLSDLFGRRPIFLFGIGIFMVGSLLAGLTQEMWQLVAARGVQGLGAGALFPIALAVIADLFAPSERGRYQGLFGAVFGLSVLVGPAIGGMITDTIGWPFVFFFNLPVGAVVFALVWRNLPLYHPAGERPRVDYLGAALFTAALDPDPRRADQQGDGRLGRPDGRRADRPRRPDPGRLPASSNRAPPSRSCRSSFSAIARSRSRWPRCSSAAFGFFATVVFLPRWFQVVAGSSATVSGYQMLPLLGGLIISAVASGQIVSRTGRYRLLIFGALGDHGERAVHADPAAGRHAAPDPVGLDVRDRHGRRPDLRGVPAHRPEQRRGPADRDGDEQPDLLPAGRRDGRSGADRHDLRVVDGGRAAAPDRRGRASAAGRRGARRQRRASSG